MSEEFTSDDVENLIQTSLAAHAKQHKVEQKIFKKDYDERF